MPAAFRFLGRVVLSANRLPKPETGTAAAKRAFAGLRRASSQARASIGPGFRNASLRVATRRIGLGAVSTEPAGAAMSATTRFGLDVVRENFETVFPAVVDAINEAKFVAFDTELTGLSAINNLEDLIDEPRERYAKLRRYATEFAVIQFGIACFRWDEDQKKYLVKPFNFYLSASTPKDTGIERRFLVQASSIEFLSEYHFDFNKAFHKGIQYLSREEEKSVRARIPSLRALDASANGGAAAAADVPAVAEVVLDAPARELVEKSTALIDDWLKNSHERTLTLPPCNGFFRRVLYQELQKKYGDAINLTSTDPVPPPPTPTKLKSMLVTRMVDPEERSALLAASQAEGLEQLQKWVGFRKVIDALQGKTVIAHNAMLDLVHTVNKFYGGPVGTLEEWKGAIRSLFGSVFDTKHMASSVPEIAEYLLSFDYGTGLSEVYEAFNAPALKFAPAIDLSIGFGSLGAYSFHDAAFDAYCTGVAFARMASFVEKYAGKLENGDSKPQRDLFMVEPEPPKPDSVADPPTVDGPIVAPFRNIIHMMRSLTSAVNLAGEDTLADLSHIFHISLTTTPAPVPPPIFSEVAAVIIKEFPEADKAFYLKRVPFDDYSWILTVNQPDVASAIAAKYLPKAPSAEAGSGMDVDSLPLLGGSWRLTSMREYKDSKFGYRKRGPPDGPAPPKRIRVRDLASLTFRLKRTALIVAAIVFAFFIGKFDLGFGTLVGMFIALAWIWDNFASELHELELRWEKERKKLERAGSYVADGDDSTKASTYHVGTNTIKTVRLEDGTTQLVISESVQWLNIFIARSWAVAQPFVSRLAKHGIEQALSNTVPPFLKAITLDKFSLGATPPRIIAIHSYPELVYCNDMQRQVMQVAVRLRWAPDDPIEFLFPRLPDESTVDGSLADGPSDIKVGDGYASDAASDAGRAPSTENRQVPGSSKTQDRGASLGSHSIIRLTATAAGPIPVSISVSASKFTVDATVFLRIYPASPFGPPWVSRLQLLSLEPPTTNLVLNPLGGSLDVFAVPYLRSWLREGIDAGLGSLLCDNGGVRIDFDADGDVQVALGLERKPFAPAAGVLYLWTYEAKGLKNADRLRLLGGTSDPFVRISLGDNVVDSTKHVINSLNPVFNHLTPLLVPESVLGTGPKTEDESTADTITLHVYDQTDVTKPISMGWTELSASDLCRNYLEERQGSAPDRPVETNVSLKGQKPGQNRGKLRIGYRFAALGSVVAGSSVPKAEASLGDGSGVLRVTILGIDFPGAKFWQGHLRASLYDREVWRGVSRQVWSRDLLVEELEVYVHEISTAIFALRVHRGVSRANLREKQAKPGAQTSSEDGTIVGEIVFKLADVLLDTPAGNWFPLAGVSSRDLKSEGETRVGIPLKLSFRALQDAKLKQDLRGMRELSQLPSFSAGKPEMLLQHSLAEVSDRPPLGVLEVFVHGARQLVPSGGSTAFIDPYCRLVKFFSEGNEFEVRRTSASPKTSDPVWTPGTEPWAVALTGHHRSRLAMWNWNRLRPDQLLGIKDIEVPETAPESGSSAGAFFRTSLSCEPDQARGKGWWELWLPLVEEAVRGSGTFKTAKHKLHVSGRFTAALPALPPQALPEPGAVGILRIVVHQIQGVVAERCSMFVELAEGVTTGQIAHPANRPRVIGRTTMRINARDALWNETFDAVVRDVRLDTNVAVLVRRALSNTSYERTTTLAVLDVPLSVLLEREAASWFQFAWHGSIRLSASFFPLARD
ncbi:hypothetical protein DFJ74DRAFT_774409 [Hyaloraphidium curvatum]|nr:hypothetical protein DFJ74DRAFT_774409 [Hyaloraphidium curvatum]